MKITRKDGIVYERKSSPCNKKMISLRLRFDQIDKLSKISAETNKNFSEILRDCVDKGIELLEIK